MCAVGTQIARSFDAEQCVVMYEPRLREQEWGMFQHPKVQQPLRVILAPLGVTGG